MRLASLEVAGFRGFSGSYSFDFDANVVVVVGANGHGKTSLFDAILWGLTGRLPRLSDREPDVLSIYSETGEARVAVSLRLDSTASKPMRVVRTFDGVSTRTTLETENGVLSGPSADGRIIDAIWSDVATATDPCLSLAAVLTQSVYLQQDLIRHFVDAETDHARYTAVSELVRAGRVTELQSSLERTKKAWSTATNEREAELQSLRARASQLGQRLEHFSAYSAAQPITTEEWQGWWKALGDLGIAARAPEFNSREAAGSLDAAIRSLNEKIHSAGRDTQRIQLMQDQLRVSGGANAPDPASFNDELAGMRSERERLLLAIGDERARVVELQQEQTRVRAKQEELQALASLALRHLADRCPVCEQDYDQERTRVRLTDIAQGGNGVVDFDSSTDKLTELLASVAACENRIAMLEAKQRAAEQQRNRREIASRDAWRQLTSLNVEVDEKGDILSELSRALDRVSSNEAKAALLRRAGESLSLRLAHTAAIATADDQRREHARLLSECAALEQAIGERRRTGDEAQRIIEGLRQAASKVVQRRLEDIEPLLDGIYGRIDPHPAFRSVELRASFPKGRGQIVAVLKDIVAQKESDKPSLVLSSSQLNALAVSIFLALNLGIQSPPLSALILDDPLQSLDDIHLLGLVDLLRRVKTHRQLLVSTHDSRFGNLLARKLRPAVNDGRTVVIELTGWSRKGPDCSHSEVHGDSVPLRLVAGS
jgi:DNA repair exonuclease SbcCD ATPase subunit